MSKYDLPPPSRIPKNLAGIAFLSVEEYSVGSYCPLPDGKGSATQVHLRVVVKGLDAPLLMRFKSAAELDRFIAALQRHRNDVWPGAIG